MSDFVICVLSLAASVFAASAGTKLRSAAAYRSFRSGLASTRLVASGRLALVAAALAAAETALACGLAAAAVAVAAGASVASLLATTVLAGAAALAGVLAGGVSRVVRQQTDARCACFGSRAARPLGREHVLRNTALLAVMLGGLAGTRFMPGRAAIGGVIVALATGAVVALLFIRWDDIFEVFAPAPRPPGMRPVQLSRRRG
jgi:hypothetical protein